MSRSNRSNAFDSNRDVPSVYVDSQQAAPVSSTGVLNAAAGLGLFAYGLCQHIQATNEAKVAKGSSARTTYAKAVFEEALAEEKAAKKRKSGCA